MGASSPHPGADPTTRIAALSRPRLTGALLRAIAAGSSVPVVGKVIRTVGADMFDLGPLREVDLHGVAPYVPTDDPPEASR